MPQQWHGFLTTSLLLMFAVLYDVTVHHVTPLTSTGPRASGSLRLVIVVSRHGNRGPLFTFPTYSYQGNDSNFWPFGETQLTGKGRDQMYRLGMKVRALYDGFLNEKYYKENFKAFSTSVDRTLMSAQAFLAGLFPPKDFQVWNDQLLWQPVPVFTTSLDHTQLLAGDPTGLCPKFAVAQRQSMAEFYETDGPSMTSLLESLLPHTGMEPASTSRAISVRRLWDSLLCADTERLILPEWATQIYPEPLETLMAKVEVASTIGSDQMIRLLQGQIFQEIASIIQAKANGSLSPDRRMFLYSGHDMTVRGLQGILGLKLWKIIKPGSAMVFELHQEPQASRHYLQVIYIDGGSTDLEPSSVNIPGCDSPCPLDILLNITEKYYNITEYNEECQLNKL